MIVVRTLTAALAALVASVYLLAMASEALGAAPVLKVTAASEPTNFVAGSDAGETGRPFTSPKYTVVATNVGSAPTSDPLTFTDTLPAGLTPTGAGGKDYTDGILGGDFPFPCSVLGQEVTCTAPRALQPGQWAMFVVSVKVDENAAGSVTNQASVVGGGAIEVMATVTSPISPSIPSFGFLPGPSGFSVAALGDEGQPATQAGSHPYQLTVDLGFPTAEVGRGPGAEGNIYNAGHPKDLTVHLPRGLVANPAPIPAQCTEAQLESQASELGGGCPEAAQVGVLFVLTELAGFYPVVSPLYKMVPPPGVAADFGTNVGGFGIFVHLKGGVNSAGEYELGADTDSILARRKNPVLGIQAQLWGDPSDPSHDPMRFRCMGAPGCSFPIERRDAPFLTMPSSCRPELSASAIAASWEDPAAKITRSAALEDPATGEAVGTNGCNQLDFGPTLTAKPTTNLSDAPTGLDVDLHVPQTTKMDELATANFKDVKVTFPPGMVVNPSGANGLGACTAAQFGLTSGVNALPVRTDANPANCPEDAKIGTVEVNTPLLDHSLPGALYVAQPYENPFGSLLAIYLAVHDEETGVVSKLAGKVEANPVTGQLTTVFKDNPELPIEDVKLTLFGGPGAALKTPLACGNHAVASDIVPWSTPEGANVSGTDSFQTSVAASGSGTCPSSEAQAPNTLSFSAGTITPQAGAYSPFVLKLSRPDGTQRLTAIDTTLPKGLLAKLAGTTYCSEAQIAVAKSREAPHMGALEQQSPSCPVSSEIGSLTVGAGAGITPFYAQGKAYLAGPYKGAPLSLVVITPAVAGPFDLGSVVARVALFVNSEAAQVHAVSDPLPTILQGIPLDIRSIALRVDRPSFTLNPTSCDPMAILGSVTAATGQSAALTSPFQVGGCSSLGFKPKLALVLKGATSRTGHPALKATVTYPKGSYSNIAKVQVTLPHSEFLAQNHIKTICTRVQFAVDACPKASIYGFAKATTPLLDQPVQGPVYLRSSSHKLPDLVAALGGQFDVDLVGRFDTGRAGGIRNTFEAVPDAPVSRFVLEMQGGKNGLLVNSENICSKPQRAVADFTAQNGKISDTMPLIANSCGKKKHGVKKRHKATH